MDVRLFFSILWTVLGFVATASAIGSMIIATMRMSKREAYGGLLLFSAFLVLLATFSWYLSDVF